MNPLTVAVLYSALCSFARAIFLQRGAIAHVPPVCKVVLLLCQASCCCPVCLCFRNMSLVFHHCMHRPVVSLLGTITYISTNIHAQCICTHREIFACFCLLILPPPLKALGVGNAASWIILSSLARFSINDFMGCYHSTATWSHHKEAFQFCSKLVSIFVVLCTFS